jgi:hypothetical protein
VGENAYVRGLIGMPLLLVLFQDRRCTLPPGFSRACVRANSTVIGFHLKASFGEPADHSCEQLAAVPSETTQMIGGPVRRTAAVDHPHFL